MINWLKQKGFKKSSLNKEILYKQSIGSDLCGYVYYQGHFYVIVTWKALMFCKNDETFRMIMSHHDNHYKPVTTTDEIEEAMRLTEQDLTKLKSN